MAATDPVEIVVDIIDEFSDELQELREELRKLDATSIDVNFELEDGGEIAMVKSQLSSIEDLVEVILNVDMVGEEQAMAMKQILEKDMYSTLHLDTDRGLDPPERAIEDFSRDSVNQAIPRGFLGRQDFDFFDEKAQSRAVNEAIQDSLNRAMPDGAFLPRGVDLFPGEGDGPDVEFDNMRGVPGDFGDMGFGFRGGIFGGRGSPFEIDAEPAEWAQEMDSLFKKLRPTIRTWTNLLAAAIPVLITLAGAAVGLVAALGAVATAGAAIVGLGLLGWGDTAAQSLKNLKQEAQLLGSELFNIIQPASMQFQPILQDWMRGAPAQIQKLVGPLSDLTVFADDLANMGSGVVDWLALVINAMVGLEKQATQVVSRFGRLAGTAIIDFLSSMLIELYRNQDAYLQLIATTGDLIGMLFNISKVVTFALSAFAPFISLVANLVSQLSTPFMSAILAAIVGLYGLNAALGAVMAAAALTRAQIMATALAVGQNLVGNIYKGIAALYSFVAAANSARAALVRLLGVTLVGLAIAAVGSMLAEEMLRQRQPGPNPGAAGTAGSGGGGNTYINIEGDARKRDIDKVLDKTSGTAQKEMRFNDALGDS